MTATVTRKDYYCRVADNFPKIDLANGNTGLGLFFSETIAQLHVKGDKRKFIVTDNSSPSGGAGFKLYLP